MKQNEYDSILKTIRSFRGLTRDCSKMLVEKYSHINKYALFSILAIEVQQRMKCMHSRLFGGEKNYYERYKQAQKTSKQSGIILQMALQINAPPSLLARHILEDYLTEKGESNSRSSLGKYLKDSTLIEDKDLAYEIFTCVLYDDQYGPVADSIALSVGEEYEVILQCCLKERNISFRNEHHLRSRGYDKTPDVKLEIPIAVNGYVINWIESKARFGNAEIHKKNVKEQFSSYWNRFGQGLVIYWFGFLDTLIQPSEKRFIILDHFPKEITYMNPNSIQPLAF
ncbi:CDAN1-interacting nuclease 1 [Leptopilina heterotoma]|uniref:CDAN1-interacting nuclease 1 n=1 Tax=Leptopilina heterotoma TaxID=63436 RepID=UPI001CA94FCD|nr:CDAN1-interacting nuclease 1 [Leptopilina heterotoma]